MTLPKLSLSGQVLLGLVLGIATGIFFGEAAASVEVLGDAFIRLLKMTVIPYIAVSLVRAIGGLDYATARQLAARGGAVAVPEPGRVKVPLGYAMPLGDATLVEFVDTWIELKQRGGTVDALFQHWILGRAAEEKKPRWSILHDVIHWGDASSGDDEPELPPAP